MAKATPTTERPTLAAELLPVLQDLCAANAELVRHYNAKDSQTLFIGRVLDKSQRASGKLFEFMDLLLSAK